MILDDIVEAKREELAALKSSLPESELRARAADLPATRDFEASLKAPGTRVIAEIKKASPSKGIIREEFNPVDIASSYEEAGAAAISVLTESSFFMGSLGDLEAVSSAVSLPCLRKDFLFDPYQIFEARVAGADAVLLIAAMLETSQITDLIGQAVEVGLASLVEAHCAPEVEWALSAGATIIGINNRDLNTFKTEIATTLELAPSLPGGVTIVSESGINTVQDITRLKGVGVDAFLIGEALMREERPGDKLKEFMK